MSLYDIEHGIIGGVRHDNGGPGGGYRIGNILTKPKKTTTTLQQDSYDSYYHQHYQHQQQYNNTMQVFILFATTILSLILFIVLVSQGAPWNNYQIFFLSIIIIILIASLVGFIFSTIRQYCWTSSTVSSNPTPTTLYTNPPPIGSAEAEFQNEYIPVFPMRQLKPRVDLDRPY